MKQTWKPGIGFTYLGAFNKNKDFKYVKKWIKISQRE